jgi:hypothetical protein
MKKLSLLLLLIPLLLLSGCKGNGIKDISVKKNSNDRVFDLSGRMVKQPSKGLYILQGKKYVVK